MSSPVKVAGAGKRRWEGGPGGRGLVVGGVACRVELALGHRLWRQKPVGMGRAWRESQ